MGEHWTSYFISPFQIAKCKDHVVADDEGAQSIPEVHISLFSAIFSNPDHDQIQTESDTYS